MPEEKSEKTDTKKKKNEGELDAFVSESIFPETQPIFTATFKSINEVKHDCLIVLDTNSLLVPYQIGKDSLHHISKTYSKLVDERRLLIPGQVAREFAKNRANKLTDLYQQFNRKASGISQLQKGRYPLLESIDAYEKTLKLEKQIDKLINEYKTAIQDVLEHIRNWTWNDPVSVLYSELFKGNVLIDLKHDKVKTMEELARRQLHGIPPGYKDAGKEDLGIGDFLIWLTILEVGKTQKRNLLFVSGDEKPDWFHRSEGRALYPRYELLDEYRRFSDGHTFHILSFSQFLSLFGASESVVNEVREEEERINLELSILGEFLRKWSEFERAVYAKYKEIDSPALFEQRATVGRMLIALYKKEVISSPFFHTAREMNELRNRVVHDQSNISTTEIRPAISILDNLIDNLKQTK
jgi:rRNA-processing protein FCF1